MCREEGEEGGGNGRVVFLVYLHVKAYLEKGAFDCSRNGIPIISRLSRTRFAYVGKGERDSKRRSCECSASECVHTA